MECHSRRRRLEFTHSQNFKTFARRHVYAFRQFEGTARVLWYGQSRDRCRRARGQPGALSAALSLFRASFPPRACHAANVRPTGSHGKSERLQRARVANYCPNYIEKANAAVRKGLRRVAQTVSFPSHGMRVPLFRPNCNENYARLSHPEIVNSSSRY